MSNFALMSSAFIVSLGVPNSGGVLFVFWQIIGGILVVGRRVDWFGCQLFFLQFGLTGTFVELDGLFCEFEELVIIVGDFFGVGVFDLTELCEKI